MILSDSMFNDSYSIFAAVEGYGVTLLVAAGREAY
jgi:hypothetical protein